MIAALRQPTNSSTTGFPSEVMNRALSGSASISVFGVTSVSRHRRNMRRSVSMARSAGIGKVTPCLAGGIIGVRPPQVASRLIVAELAVREARFLEVEIAFDVPPGFVGDLAVAQQDVDELPFGCNQFPRQITARRGSDTRIRIERIGQLVGAGFMPRAQKPDHLIGYVAMFGDLVERFERGIEGLASRRDFRFELGRTLVAAGLRDAEPADDRRQSKSEADQRDENDAEGDEQDQVAVGKRAAVRQCEG